MTGRNQSRDPSDELLRSAVAAAPDGILIVDADGVIRFVNPMTTTLFGYAETDIVGQPVEMLVPESRRPEHLRVRNGYIRDPHTRAMGTGLELNGRRRDGSEFPVEISLSPVRQGDAAYVIAVVRDVTEQRASARDLMEAHEQLALLDDRERIARDLHDTVIQRLFAIGLALQGALIATTDPALAKRIEGAIDEIDGTIRDIRTAIFSLHSRRAPMSGLRDDVLATAREAARALGFEPQVAFDGPVDTVTASEIREQLVPALREALSNVVKHAHASHVAVSVAAVGGQVVLQITDNGVGLSAETHGGRGLANIDERAAMLGGSCSVLSGPAGGTVVTWRVPAISPESAAR